MLHRDVRTFLAALVLAVTFAPPAVRAEAVGARFDHINGQPVASGVGGILPGAIHFSEGVIRNSELLFIDSFFVVFGGKYDPVIAFLARGQTLSNPGGNAIAFRVGGDVMPMSNGGTLEGALSFELLEVSGGGAPSFTVYAEPRYGFSTNPADDQPVLDNLVGGSAFGAPFVVDAPGKVGVTMPVTPFIATAPGNPVNFLQIVGDVDDFGTDVTGSAWEIFAYVCARPAGGDLCPTAADVELAARQALAAVLVPVPPAFALMVPCVLAIAGLGFRKGLVQRQ